MLTERMVKLDRRMAFVRALAEATEGVPEQRIVFRNQADNRSDLLGRRTALGTDPTGSYWAVQINEADTPGDANVTSGIAVDEQGTPFLIRQGRLNSPVAGNRPTSCRTVSPERATAFETPLTGAERPTLGPSVIV